MDVHPRNEYTFEGCATVWSNSTLKQREETTGATPPNHLVMLDVGSPLHSSTTAGSVSLPLRIRIAKWLYRLQLALSFLLQQIHQFLHTLFSLLTSVHVPPLDPLISSVKDLYVHSELCTDHWGADTSPIPICVF